MNYIHCLNNISTKGTNLLPDEYQLTDDVDQATGILVRSAKMHDMEFSDNLLAIARAGAGVNNIPLDRCAQEGIVVFNAPGANANAVKEITIAALLLGSRGIVEGIDWTRANADDPDIAKKAEKAKKQFAGREILGKKLGVIGLGAIGAKVANAAVDLGMDVYGYDPYVSVKAAWNISSAVHHVTDLVELCGTCDYLTIHVPAMDSTKGMISAEAIAAMQPGTVFLNFSRDTLVDGEAMAAALAEGRVARYITDFATPAVMQMEHTLVLPHLGASTAEAEDNCAIMATNELMDYIDNGNITNSVNFPAVSAGVPAEGNGRIAVLHGNVPNMVGQITAILAKAGANIANMANASRGNAAYTLIDTDAPVDDGVQADLAAIEGVRRVRIIA